MTDDIVEMTGETKDVVLEATRLIADLEIEQRCLAMQDVLDRLCSSCGSELPKYDECLECGEERFRDRTLSAQLLGLTDEERKAIFSDFCGHCGSSKMPCHCWNDE